MNRLLTLFGLLLTLCAQQATAQCNFSVNSNGFEYTVDVDLSVSNVFLTQQGTSCNVQLEVTYDIAVNVITAPPWWNGKLYTLQGNLDCIGASGSSFFSLPNETATGTVTSATFTFPSTDCVNAFFDCPINIEIGGPELNQNNAPCGLFDGNLPLPIVLSDFAYTKSEGGGFDLFWATETELDFSHFDVEMSKDFESWNNVATVLGENSRFGASYHHAVSAIGQGNYIRLKMVDEDGSYEYSDALYLPNISDRGVSVYPNPVADVLYLEGVKSQDVIVFNALGQQVYVSRYSDYSLDISKLEPGHYIMLYRQQMPEDAPLRFVKM